MPNSAFVAAARELIYDAEDALDYAVQHLETVVATKSAPDLEGSLAILRMVRAKLVSAHYGIGDYLERVDTVRVGDASVHTD